MQHAKRTFALVEVDYPFKIEVNKTKEGLYEVESIGFDNFGGQLTHNVSAHPKVDRKNGELYAFGYDYQGKPIVRLSVFDK